MSRSGRLLTVLIFSWFVIFQHRPVCWALEPYRVGPADEIGISVPVQGSLDYVGKLAHNLPFRVIGGKIFFDYKVTVAPDGTISLPALPQIHVDGMTLMEIENLIEQELRKKNLGETVSVTLIEPHSASFSLMGEVRNPGRFVLRGPLTIIEALAGAGGGTERGQLKKVRLYRSGEIFRTMDLRMKNLDSSEAQLIIQPRDIIYVPSKLTPDHSTILLLLTVVIAGTGVYVAGKQ